VANKIVIDKVQPEDHNTTITCAASEYQPVANVLNTVDKTVVVEVYSELVMRGVQVSCIAAKPTFDKSNTRRFAMLGRKAILVCRVATSNPPVNQFVFYKGNTDIFTTGRYVIDTDYRLTTATLTVCLM
jgi:hypothetical protein